MWARAALAALSIIGFSNIVPIARSCHGGNLTGPLADAAFQVFIIDRSFLHNAGEEGLSEPISVENVSEPEIDLRANHCEGSPWRSLFDILLNRHIWDKCAVWRRFTSRRNVHADLFQPVFIRSAWRFAGIPGY